MTCLVEYVQARWMCRRIKQDGDTTDKVDTTDIAELMELQLISYDRVNCKVLEPE